MHTNDTLKINSHTHRVVTLGILVYRDFLKYLITIQEFTICLNISIIHLTEKLKFQIYIKWKTKKYHIVGTITKSNIKIVERGKVSHTNASFRLQRINWHKNIHIFRLIQKYIIKTFTMIIFTMIIFIIVLTPK